MLKKIGLLLLSAGVFFGGTACSTDSGDVSGWQPAGIPDTEVFTIQAQDGMLFAGTREGVFTRDLRATGRAWQAKGLAVDSAKVIDFVLWSRDEVVAGISYDDYRTQKPTLFKSDDAGRNWSPVKVVYPEDFDIFFPEGHPGRGLFDVQHLEKISTPVRRIAAIVNGVFIKSRDNGENWEVSLERLHIPEFLTASPFHSNQIWTGGWTPLHMAALTKSKDRGESWIQLGNNIGFARAYDAIVHPFDPNQVLVGMVGSVDPHNIIRKSTDGGQTWTTVRELINARTLTHSAASPTTVYASGRNTSGTLFFARSTNFGDRWETVEMPESPADVWINDMVSVTVGGREVLYLGTNRGVYSYTFAE